MRSHTTLMQNKIQLPEKLTKTDVQNIVYVFSHMSAASKDEFISSLLMTHEKHYNKIVDALGLSFSSYIGRA